VVQRLVGRVAHPLAVDFHFRFAIGRKAKESREARDGGSTPRRAGEDGPTLRLRWPPIGVTRRSTKTVAYPFFATYIVRHVEIIDNDPTKVDR
jgi:hypothetical protein